MTFTETGISDLIIIEPKVFKDARGYFYEVYNQERFHQAGIKANFVQDNQSYSTYGTIRGLHLQIGDYSQAKLVRVLKGEVLDVAVDLRENSPTYGQHFSIHLNENNKKQLFIPRGFAHGFSVLSDTAIFAYKCDNFYNKDSEAGIIFNDKDLDIDWKIPQGEEVVSEKDLLLGTLNDLNNRS